MPAKKTSPLSQRERFIALAKEIAPDATEATFRKQLGQIAKAPPVEDPRDFPSTKKASKKAKKP